MTFAPPSHPDCPPAYGGCTCSCHRMPGVKHCFPCCRPTNREAHEAAAGMGLDAAFFTFNGIDPNAPAQDEECIEPAAYDAPVVLTAGQSPCPTCDDTKTVNAFTPGPLARETGDMENHPAPCPVCTCKPDDMPPDVVTPDCPKHDPIPGTSPSYKPLPECCGKSPRHCDCLGDNPAEPCWGAVQQNTIDIGEEGPCPIHECQGHYDRCEAYYTYKPEPPTPPRT